MSIVNKPWKLYNTIKTVLKGKTQKTTGTGAIDRMSPNVPITKSQKLDAKHKINMAQIPGKVFHRYKKIGEVADSMNREGRKMKQYLRGEKETYSGVSKGKDLKTKKDNK